MTPSGSAPSYNLNLPFTLKIKLQITGTFNGGQLMCGDFRIYTRTDNAGNAFVVEWIDTNGNSTYIRISASDIPISLNTWYTVTVEHNNGTVTLTATDGTRTKTVTQSVPAHRAVSSFAFGNYTNNTQLNLFFDFSEMYWKQNGTILWGNSPS